MTQFCRQAIQLLGSDGQIGHDLALFAVGHGDALQVAAEHGRSAALFLGGGGDGGELVTGRATLLVDLGQRGGHFGVERQAFLHQCIALLHGADGVAGFLLDAGDHAGNLIGGFTGARGQAADFVSHHGKAATLFAGARGLDGSVEREQVGLVGNRGDYPDDAADFLRALAQRVDDFGGAAQRSGDLLQRRRRLFHRGATDACLLGIFLGQALGIAHVVGDVHRRGAELFDGTGHAGDLAGLLFHALERTARQAGQHVGAGADFLRRGTDMRHHR